MDFGYKLKELNGKLNIVFKGKVDSWIRPASKLIEDRVILDTKNARRWLGEKGDMPIYEVFSFKGFDEKTRNALKATDLQCDITLLRQDIFSISKDGESFSTYGHIHEKPFGEAYSVLKNECLFELTHRKTLNTFIVHLKEGNSIFIHPNFLHRTISYRKDCLVVNFVPRQAGHNYKIVKNRGFPFHVFYDKKNDKMRIVKNKNYKGGKFKLIKKVEAKINPIRLFERNPEKLKDMLENHMKYKNIYFT